jgi:hypothetical protein
VGDTGTAVGSRQGNGERRASAGEAGQGATGATVQHDMMRLTLRECVGQGMLRSAEVHDESAEARGRQAQARDRDEPAAVHVPHEAQRLADSSVGSQPIQ